jgi:creatinine amidohydrolase
LEAVVRFVDLTYPEIAARARAGALAVVPMGCTEQQGPQLGVGFDTWFADELTETAATLVHERFGVDALVLPAFPFGPTPEHRGYGAGYVDLTPAVHDAVLTALLASLADQGFARVAVWRGCGGHNLVDVVNRFNQRRAGSCHAWLLPKTDLADEHPFHLIWCQLGDQRDFGGHADSFTTSIALSRHPELVHEDRIPGPSQHPNWDDPNLDFTDYSETGVIGDPRYANADLGAALWDACVTWLATTLESIATSPVQP